MNKEDDVTEEESKPEIYDDSQFKRDLIKSLEEIASNVWNVNYEFEEFRRQFAGFRDESNNN